MNFLWLVGLACLSASVHAQSEVLQTPKRDQRRKFCGKFLADTLSLVCGGFYNEWSKKDTMFSDTANDDYAYDSEEGMEALQAAGWPLLPRQLAALQPSGFRRARRGVYDECCRKTCSVHELRSYCGH